MSAISRRAFLAGATATALAAPVVWSAAARAAATEEAAGQMLVIGFPGKDAKSAAARRLAEHIGAGKAGGAVFLRHNIGSGASVRALNALFRGAGASRPPLLCVDQEGGKVQRLQSRHGATTIPPAQTVASTLDADGARGLYAKLARDIRAAGFNVNLAPVVDIYDPKNPVIGSIGRSYGSNPEEVARYARAFIKAHHGQGVLCALKHFPGHGRSRGDSHNGFVDITRAWKEDELAPYASLIKSGDADIIMGGHLIHDGLTKGVPVTFSSNAIGGVLRRQLGFGGAVMTDDLDMAAIRDFAATREAVMRAARAGNDLILLSNSARYDPELAPKAAGWIAEAAAKGDVPAAHVERAYERVRALKSRVS